MDLSSVSGNPTNGLQAHYNDLMVITDLDSLKTKVLEVVEPYRGHGISPKNYMKFKTELEKCDTLQKVQKYISNYILAGAGMGVV